MPQNGFQQRDNNGHKFFVKFCKVFLKFLQNQKKKKKFKNRYKKMEPFSRNRGDRYRYILYRYRQRLDNRYKHVFMYVWMDG